MKQKLYHLKNYIRSILGHKNGLSKIDNNQDAINIMKDAKLKYGQDSLVRLYSSNAQFSSIWEFKNKCNQSKKEIELAPIRRAKQKERMKQYLN